MIKGSTVAQTCIVGVACPILSTLDVLFSLSEFVVPTEKVNQLCKYRVLVRFLFKHPLELLHGFFILIAFKQNLS